jgi:hypothetical protein
MQPHQTKTKALRLAFAVEGCALCRVTVDFTCAGDFPLLSA